MTGHTKTDDDLTSVLWADAELERISVNYDEFSILIRESTGRSKQITCAGYIGYELVGFWDEIVIERADLSSGDHDLARQCVQRLEKRYPKGRPSTGSAARNAGSWRVLTIEFSDGARLEVVAAAFSASPATEE